MRHRLSPRDTIVVALVVAVLGSSTRDTLRFGGGAAAVACSRETASSCTNRFATAVSRPLNAISARDWNAPGLDSSFANATTTPCLDVASLPLGNLALNVSS